MSGFTKFDNDFLSNIYGYEFSSEKELRIVLYIHRMTVGFNQKECVLSAHRISKNTNIPQRTVHRCLKNLTKNGFVKRRLSGKNNTYSYSLSYATGGNTSYATGGNTTMPQVATHYKDTIKDNIIKEDDDFNLY